jgi:3',5'-cyclic AMP phosphodiesterase CpdA
MKLLGMPGPWYRTTIGDADIIVLDANRLNEESQTRWLRTQLRSARLDWTIVIMHQPPYSCSRGGDPQVREHWAPLLEEYEVDLVISGHEHNYQRFLSDEQTTYVVTGGGGDRLYPVGDCDASFPPLVVSDDENHHFFVFEGSATRLEGAAIGMDGSVLDQFTIRKGRDR